MEVAGASVKAAARQPRRRGAAIIVPNRVSRRGPLESPEGGMRRGSSVGWQALAFLVAGQGVIEKRACRKCLNRHGSKTSSDGGVKQTAARADWSAALMLAENQNKNLHLQIAAA